MMSLSAATASLNSINTHEIIGVDLGGTKIHVARTNSGIVQDEYRYTYNALASEEAVIHSLIVAIERLMSKHVIGIGIGVPSIVDVNAGIVFETVNIPSWKEVHLQSKLEAHFKLPVKINNDVNCFILGEHNHGVARGKKNVVGLCLGTGMGVGLIINNQLYNGNNCGAGELGNLPYKDGILEHYCSGQFFERFHNTTGIAAFNSARKGNEKSLAIFNEFGTHLANAISTILLAYDPEMIILGGSVSYSHEFFTAAINKEMASFPFKKMWENTKIAPSQNHTTAVLGAACLCNP